MLPLFPHGLAIGHTNDLILFNYGVLLLFHIKCTASLGVENPGVEMYLTLAETQVKIIFLGYNFFLYLHTESSTTTALHKSSDSYKKRYAFELT